MHAPNTAGPLFRISSYTRPHLLTLAASALLRFVNTGLGIALLGLAGYYVARAIDAGIVPGPQEWIIFVVLGVLKAVARYLEQVSGHVAAFRILDTLRGRIYEWFAVSPGAGRSAEPAGSGDIVSRAMGDVELVEVYFAHTLAPVAVSVPIIILLSVGTGLVAGPATALGLAGLLVLAGYVLPVFWQRLNSTLARNSRNAVGILSGQVTETLAGLTDIVTSGADQRWARKLTSHTSAVSDANSRLIRRNAFKDISVDIALVSALFVVGIGSIDARASAAELWGLVCAVAGSFGVVLAISRAVDDLPRSAAAAARILELEREVAAGDLSPRAEPAAHAGAESGAALAERSGRGTEPDARSRASRGIVCEGIALRYGVDRGLQELDLHIP